MFDTICTLPLTSDLFAQAIHPKSSIIAVGLASGHVQTYVLPNLDSSPDTPPQNGCGTIDTAWRTKRHKGSCRSLTFSSYGETLYSAGTDGIVKAARTETGVVEAKIAVPLSKYPLPPQCPHVPARIYEMDGLMRANHNPRQLPPRPSGPDPRLNTPSPSPRHGLLRPPSVRPPDPPFKNLLHTTSNSSPSHRLHRVSHAPRTHRHFYIRLPKTTRHHRRNHPRSN